MSSSPCTTSPRMVVETHQDPKGKGRHVVATMGLQPGDAIFAAPPDIAVLYSPFASHICARCLVTSVSPSPRASPPPLPLGATPPPPPPPGALRTGDPYRCPSCDQFVLCAACVTQLLNDVAAGTEVSAVASDPFSTPPMVGRRAKFGVGRVSKESTRLAQHPLLRVHAISCAWYTSLPAAIRAPGNDTDFLRFCLDYGARVLLGDTEMVRALESLDTNASVQSKEATQLCEVFARDRVVATFGKEAPPTSAVRTPFATAPVTAPRYPVPWTELRDILLRTRCNSLGFPYNAEETTGWSLQETICMLNHSCTPNAAVIMLFDTEAANGPTSSSEAPSDATGAGSNSGPRKGLGGSTSSGGGSGSASTVRDRAAAFRAVAALSSSSASRFCTSYSPSLAGWIGIEATRPIAAGEEITISYLDLGIYGDDVQARSRHLLEQYRFLCMCELCVRQRNAKR